MTAYDDEVPVLIVGGGYAGLASALFLSHHGVRSVLVDRHSAVSMLGRARGINQRTMEIYRPLGIEQRIRDAGRPFDTETGVVRCATLTDQWHWILDPGTPRVLPELTPGVFGMADQSSVEPILIEAARDRGADIRFNTQCASIDVRAEGVTALTVDRDSGRRRTVRADYLIAADGHRSSIREWLGIARPGPGVTEYWVSFVIEADLSDIVTRRALLWIVVNPEIGVGSILTQAVPGQWVISVTYDPEKESAADFTADRCVEVARAVIGRDQPVKVLDITSWEQAVGVADRFRSGRVFLTGDSAHVWPPAGAMGANAAVQDAHNLAWKLAAVIGGRATDGLLDTYETERRAVARALAEITVRRQETRFGAGPGDDDVDDVLCILGQRYRSAAVVGAEHDAVYGDAVEQHARPGTRAPHLWLDLEGRLMSAHDLFHDSFVLLTGPEGGLWTAAAEQAPTPVRAYRVLPLPGKGLVDVEGNWPDRYRLGPAGAVLVRPDGYVAWRAEEPPADPAGALAAALRRVHGHPREPDITRADSEHRFVVNAMSGRSENGRP